MICPIYSKSNNKWNVRFVNFMKIEAMKIGDEFAFLIIRKYQLYCLSMDTR